MTPTHGLEDRTVLQINAVLRSFPEVERAILFGSRAKGNFRPGSDIDLALEGEAVDWRVIGRIELALDDLPTPYSFSIIEHSPRTDPAVAAHISRVGQLFYEKAAPPSATPRRP